MGKLYFHCGIYCGVLKIKPEVLGSLYATGLEMSTIGRELRIPDEGERHVFSNNDNLFNGLRVAISKGLIDVADLVVHYDHIVDGKVQTTMVTFTQDGCATHWPIGFFDQCENDLMTLLNWEPIA